MASGSIEAQAVDQEELMPMKWSWHPCRRSLGWGQLKDAVHPKYVISDKYQKWHVVPKFADVPVKQWKARCGWRYGCSKYGRRSRAPAVWGPDEKCPRCFDLPNVGVDSD